MFINSLKINNFIKINLKILIFALIFSLLSIYFYIINNKNIVIRLDIKNINSHSIQSLNSAPTLFPSSNLKNLNLNFKNWDNEIKNINLIQINTSHLPSIDKFYMNYLIDNSWWINNVKPIYKFSKSDGKEFNSINNTVEYLEITISQNFFIKNNLDLEKFVNALKVFLVQRYLDGLNNYLKNNFSIKNIEGIYNFHEKRKKVFLDQMFLIKKNNLLMPDSIFFSEFKDILNTITILQDFKNLGEIDYNFNIYTFLKPDFNFNKNSIILIDLNNHVNLIYSSLKYNDISIDRYGSPKLKQILSIFILIYLISIIILFSLKFFQKMYINRK